VLVLVLLELRDKRCSLVSAFKELRVVDVLVVGTKQASSVFEVFVFCFFCFITCCCFGSSLVKEQQEATGEGRSESLLEGESSVAVVGVVGASTAVLRLTPALSTSEDSAKH